MSMLANWATEGQTGPKPPGSLRRWLADLLVLFVLLHASTQVESYDCKGTFAQTSLKDYQINCHWIMNSDESYLDMNTITRLDIVQTCACNLLDKSMVWESMLTHEVEAMYYAVREMALKIGSQQDPSIATTSMLKDADFANRRAYVWDLTHQVMTEWDPKSNGIELSREFERQLAQVYFNPETLKRPFKNEPESMDMRLMIFYQCKALGEKFADFKFYMENMAKLMVNERLVYRLVDNHATLYKLWLVYQMCLYLKEAEEFIQ